VTIIPVLTTPPKLFSWGHTTWYIFPLMFLQSFLPLLFLIPFKNIGIMHCRSYPVTCAAIAVKKLFGVKVVFDPRSPFVQEGVTKRTLESGSLTYLMWEKLEKLFLDASDMTITITESFEEYYSRLSDRVRFARIPNNVDVARFMRDTTQRNALRKKYGLGEGCIVLCYSGSLGESWNHPQLYGQLIIKLRVLGKDHKFLFITRNLDYLIKTFERMGISEGEYIAVTATPSEVPCYLSMADIGMNLMKIPDIRLSIKTVEYLSMGLPVITNHCVKGAKEIVEKFGVGYVLEEDVKSADLEILKSFVMNAMIYSENCREVACENFSTEVVAFKVNELYRHLQEGS